MNRAPLLRQPCVLNGRGLTDTMMVSWAPLRDIRLSSGWCWCYLKFRSLGSQGFAVSCFYISATVHSYLISLNFRLTTTDIDLNQSFSTDSTGPWSYPWDSIFPSVKRNLMAIPSFSLGCIPRSCTCDIYVEWGNKRTTRREVQIIDTHYINIDDDIKNCGPLGGLNGSLKGFG